uniref:Uncharacterized protein n=1 Tax=Molossus molossus TaxID=27622 RepID=A0A7J8FRX7_MOLMO|nr:hypothetical protein HJG59_008395 [Molossus molossus]
MCSLFLLCHSSSWWFFISNWLIVNVSMSLLMLLMSLLMLLNFFKIITLNSTSDNLLNCISFISCSVEVSCSFIWDLFFCFTILAISVGLEPARFSLWVLVFCCLWLPLLGLDEHGKTHVKPHC